MNKSVDRFIREFFAGSQTAAAAALGVAQPTVSEWLRGIRPVPHEKCADIERLSNGVLLATDARADDRWARIADKQWPHPKGRPALDVTKAAA